MPQALPGELQTLADALYTDQALNARRVANDVQGVWQTLPPPSSPAFWNDLYGAGATITDRVAAGQIDAAIIASNLLTQIATLQDVDVPSELVYDAFITPTPVVLHSLDYAGTVARNAYFADQSTAWMAGMKGLSQFLQDNTTRVQDAGRTAMHVHAMATPGLTNYIRKLERPSCSRCAILAGSVTKVTTAFKRHPECDCQNVPIADSFFDPHEYDYDVVEAIRAGEVTGLSKADTEAIIEHGADPSQIINAKDGSVRAADLYGHKLKTTLAGTTKRGTYGRTQSNFKKGHTRYYRAQRPRLTPDGIVKAANNRDEVRRMLEAYGYIR